jgi:glycosyltransferase involved in cell wall biosynthesis
MPGSAVRPTVAVVIPTHNRATLLPRLVAALEAQHHPPAEVVIVDDGSADHTPAVLARLAASTSLPLVTVRFDRSRGPAVARNTGWRQTTASLVAFTDDDCVPQPGWLAAAADAMTAAPRSGVLQGATRPPDDAVEGRWAVTRRVDGPTPFFEACNLVLRREALETAGGFDETLVMHGEDTALGWAVIERGWERGFEADAVVEHDLSHPGLGWHLRQAWMQGNLVPLAIRHPGLRATFWRPWAFRRHEVVFAAAVVGAAAARRAPAALVLTVPYVWAYRTSRPDGAWLRDRLEVLAFDAVTLASMLRASLRHGQLVL